LTKLARLRQDVSDFISDAGDTYNITHYTIASEDVWGRNKSANNDTEDLFVVEKIEVEKLRREGQKEIAYYIILANYDSILEIGDKIIIDTKDCWIRALQPGNYQGETFLKRITAIVEEWR